MLLNLRSLAEPSTTDIEMASGLNFARRSAISGSTLVNSSQAKSKPEVH